MHSNTTIHPHVAEAIERATRRKEARSVRRANLAKMVNGGGRTLIRATEPTAAEIEEVELDDLSLRPEGEVLMDTQIVRGMAEHLFASRNKLI